MTFQADELHLRTYEYPGIHGPVRLVTGAAAFQLHRSVLENERASQVAMTLHAARFIGAHGAQVSRQIVAVHAGHRAFRQPVPVRPLEAGPNVDMAPCAELIYINYFLRDQTIRAIP